MEKQQGNHNNDILIATIAADILTGVAGNDILLGLAEDDLLFGNADDDLVFGNTGFGYPTRGTRKRSVTRRRRR